MSEEQKEQAGVVDPTTGAVVTPEEGAAVESVPEETLSPEKVKELQDELKFTKQRHQNLIGDLDQFDPSGAAYQKWKDEQFQAEQATPESGTPAVSESATVADSDEYLTVGAAAQMEQRIIKANTVRDEKMRQEQQLAGLQAEYNNEYNAALAAVNTVTKDLKIPQDVVDQINAQVNGYGINVKQPGGPSGFARAFYTLAQGYKPTDAPPPGSTPEEIAAQDKARQAGLMAQPNGAPMSTPAADPAKALADAIAPSDPPFEYPEGA